MNKEKHDIREKDDIVILVTQFYTKVRSEKNLGPIFNRAISDWPAHLEHISNFWETSLFMAKSYKGNPVIAHQKVDDRENNSLEMSHFGIWINLWMETVNELFEGEIANLAIRRARNMASILFIKIFENRSK